MNIQSIFYGVAIFFLFITIGYFVSEYLNYITTRIKSILLFVLAIFLFVVGDYLRRIEK